MNKRLLIVVLGALGVAANQVAVADQAECNTVGCTTAILPVTFSIKIPAFLRLQVGAVGANANVVWDTAVTVANMGTGGNLAPDTVTNGGGGGGEVVYVLKSNISTSNATITATGTAAAFIAGGNQIPYTKVNATAVDTSGNGAVALPVPAAPTIVTPTSGIIDRAGIWNYYYVNDTMYPAGTYLGQINYTVTQP